MKIKNIHFDKGNANNFGGLYSIKDINGKDINPNNGEYTLYSKDKYVLVSLTLYSLTKSHQNVDNAGQYWDKLQLAQNLEDKNTLLGQDKKLHTVFCITKKLSLSLLKGSNIKDDIIDMDIFGEGDSDEDKPTKPNKSRSLQNLEARIDSQSKTLIIPPAINEDS